MIQNMYFTFQRHFYGPQERWMSIPGIFSIETLVPIIKEIRKGTPGNYIGEGRLLGGDFLYMYMSRSGICLY